MKYNPPNILDEQDDMFHPEQIAVGETTKFLRYGAELENTELTCNLIKKHTNLASKISKFMPLGNYSSKMKFQKQIEQIRSDIISMLEDVGLDEEAEEYVLFTLQDAQFSRGIDGFFTKEQNMLRYKIKQEGEKEKKNRWGVFKHKDDNPADSEMTWR